MTDDTAERERLVKRLREIEAHDWRVSHLAHTSDTAGEAATALESLAAAPPPRPADTMRTEFEAWANEREMHIGWDAEEEEYQSYPTHVAWLAWQASAEAERGRVINQDIATFLTVLAEHGVPPDTQERILANGALAAALNRTAAQQET
jgi:hypothetical protein